MATPTELITQVRNRNFVAARQSVNELLRDKLSAAIKAEYKAVANETFGLKESHVTEAASNPKPTNKELDAAGPAGSAARAKLINAWWANEKKLGKLSSITFKNGVPYKDGKRVSRSEIEG